MTASEETRTREGARTQGVAHAGLARRERAGHADFADTSTQPSTQVAIIYFSRRGRLVTLANVIAEGARQVPGAVVEVFRIRDPVGGDNPAMVRLVWQGERLWVGWAQERGGPRATFARSRTDTRPGFCVGWRGDRSRS